nr:hypothetical protein Iba_chr08cCG4980 [Ipomoea batatas]
MPTARTSTTLLTTPTAFWPLVLFRVSRLVSWVELEGRIDEVLIRSAVAVLFFLAQRFFLSAVDGGGGSGGKAKTSSLSSPELRKVKPQPTDIWADETWRLRAEEERWVLVTGKSTAVMSLV